MLKHIITIGIFTLLSASSFAQRADQIIEKYLEAIGGEDALRELEGHKMTYNVSTSGIQLELINYTMADGRIHMSYEILGKSNIVNVFDGTVLWGLNPSTQKPEKKSEEELETIKRSMDEFPNPFLDYEDKGFWIEMIDVEDVNGIDCYKIEVTKKPLIIDGEEVENIQYYFFDQDTYLPIQVEFEEHYGVNIGKTRTTSYSDYQEVDGLYFPFKMSVLVSGEKESVFTVKTVEINPDVDDDFFTYPGK